MCPATSSGAADGRRRLAVRAPRGQEVPRGRACIRPRPRINLRVLSGGPARPCDPPSDLQRCPPPPPYLQHGPHLTCSVVPPLPRFTATARLHQSRRPTTPTPLGAHTAALSAFPDLPCSHPLHLCPTLLPTQRPRPPLPPPPLPATFTAATTTTSAAICRCKPRLGRSPLTPHPLPSVVPSLS